MATQAEQVADLPTNALGSFIESLSEEEAQALLYSWEFWARPEQLTPAGDWNVWLILAGRGWGKTRTGAEDVKAFGLNHPNSRIAVVAPTYGDARDTCIEGESGLLRLLPHDAIRLWNRSLGELELTNGARYKLFSADQPERLRGPQHHRAWCDELAAWRYAQETWDMLMFGLRLGTRPQAVCTTTPKPVRLLRELLERLDVYVTRGSTFDNSRNLAGPALDQLKARYLSTRIGRQELYAEILDDTPGALWKRDALEAARVTHAPDALARVVVAVDPAITATEGSDETGIVAAGVGASNGDGYILRDASLRGSPLQWARVAVGLYHDLHADRIIAEANQGGDMVKTTIQTIDRNVPVTLVHATRGKLTRAEPVAALYEQGRVHHVGAFPDLEDQMATWTQGDASPDRLDALVWALTDLMLTGKEPRLRFFDDPKPRSPWG